MFLIILALFMPSQIPAQIAKDNRALAFKAVSGELMLMRGQLVRLDGILCPPADTESGRKAKALLNTFMRAGMGTVRCRIYGPDTDRRAICLKERRNFADGMVQSGLCTRGFRPPKAAQSEPPQDG